jgi:Uma2 family endonuclease
MATMAAPPQKQPVGMTEAEYLEFERAGELKYEYVGGEIVAMTGASWNHNVICVNISTSLNNQLADKNCMVTANDLRLKIATARSYRYPDVMVVCGEPSFVDERVDIIDNPIVVVEVLSNSTALVDRNEKLHEYLQLASLQEYVIISQYIPKIERYLRQDSGDWLYTQVSDLKSSLDLPSINCKLALDDAYRKVVFDNLDEE